MLFRSHIETDIASAHIVISGSSVVLCEGDQWIDVVKKGQGVLNVLAVAAVKAHIDEQLDLPVAVPGDAVSAAV